LFNDNIDLAKTDKKRVMHNSMKRNIAISGTSGLPYDYDVMILSENSVLSNLFIFKLRRFFYTQCPVYFNHLSSPRKIRVVKKLSIAR